MKKKLLLCILLTNLFLFHTKAQITPVEEIKIEESQITPETKTNIDITTKKSTRYRVEEVITQNFGGRKIMYEVGDPRLISTYALAANHTRVVTPLYGEEEKIDSTKVKPIAKNINANKVASNKNENKAITEISNEKKKSKNEEPKVKPDDLKTKETPKASTAKTEKNGDYANIDIIKTYERVTDKGFQSVEMLKKVGNLYFFNGELEKAEKCYTKLFSKTTDLEPEYYYRYSIALKSTGDLKRSNEYLTKYNQLNTKSK